MRIYVFFHNYIVSIQREITINHLLLTFSTLQNAKSIRTLLISIPAIQILHPQLKISKTKSVVNPLCLSVTHGKQKKVGQGIKSPTRSKKC